MAWAFLKFGRSSKANGFEQTVIVTTAPLLKFISVRSFSSIVQRVANVQRQT